MRERLRACLAGTLGVALGVAGLVTLTPAVASAAPSTHPATGSAAPHIRRHLFDFVPDDPYFTKQSRYLDAVHAPAAWTRQRGSAKVIIAVIDSGIDVNHPDLKSKIIGTYNAIDPKSSSIHDSIGHGTFVAGIAAADTDNGIGVAGAGANTRLLGVKVAGADDTIAIGDEVAGIRWAADHHADVINLSLGGPDYSRSEARAVAYAQAKGALVVAAAGNVGGSTKQYPAAYPGVVAVASTDTITHSRAGFSSHGPWVSVAAPGVGIVSTTPRHGSHLFGTRAYAVSGGTSFSTPIVAAEAALLKAQNPTLSADELRAAVVDSAHGYQHLGLGAGQVDFTLGLDHVRPTTTPTTLVPSGTADNVAVRAASSAPAVAFRIDSGTWSAPVAVHHGTAETVLNTDGYRNGAHVLSAVDCTRFAECNTTARSVPLPLDNPAGKLTSPSTGSRVTGLVTIQARRPAGGDLRLLLDHSPRGAPIGAPYRFQVSASDLTDGPHTMQVQLCSSDGARCDGPTSAPVNVQSVALHPGAPVLAAERISPNADGVRDATTLTYTLPDSESVQVRVLDRAGTPVAHADLGRLTAGRHTSRWAGTADDGSDLTDGTYTVALATSRGDVRGWVSDVGVVDTAAPRMSTPSAAPTFYPYPDHYHDILRPTVLLGGAGALKLEVVNAVGHRVRRIVTQRRTGVATVDWDGTNGNGHRVPAGRYRYQVTITDAAGNSRSAPPQQVVVSGRRLHHRTITVTTKANRYDGSGASSSCSRVSAAKSAYPGGVLLTNTCPAKAYDIAYAQYTFTVPSVIRYTSLTIAVYGHAGSGSSELTTSFRRNDGVFEVPAYLKVHPGTATWHAIASVPARDHVTGRHHVHASLVLTGAYPGHNSFDAARIRLRLHAVVLR